MPLILTGASGLSTLDSSLGLSIAKWEHTLPKPTDEQLGAV